MTQAYMPKANTVEWETPQWLFNQLNAEFNFTIDVCATAENTKCARFYSLAEDGLIQDWCGETAYCNPPYGREMPKWIRKAREEANKGATVVMLIPARTDTKAFHEYIYGKTEIRFLKGRLKFGDSKNAAPFPSMVVIFRMEGDRMDADAGGVRR